MQSIDQIWDAAHVRHTHTYTDNPSEDWLRQEKLRLSSIAHELNIPFGARFEGNEMKMIFASRADRQAFIRSAFNQSPMPVGFDPSLN